ncbi:hypothetical protein LTS08_007477 [Lithohypha guttulata]|nr:hypothetical protein LTS08_007477 [Lithohypha guttulata]
MVESMSGAYIERQTLCMAGSNPGVATHAGEDDFAVRLRRNYKADENNVAERLILFKTELSKLEGEAFWTKLMVGMTEICHAQFAFVSKRILVDDHTVAVEMPKIGEQGACLMAVALYYNDHEAKIAMHHDYKYYAWSCPCAYMKHDKVFLIEDNLHQFIQNNPNQLPFEVESYLGVPLFANGKCYAHFGMMWTKEGLLQKQGLSWAFVELFMHSLEDMITERLLAGQGFAKSAEQLQQDSRKVVIPQAAITATQSLKLYARSLSHELRTPMQGVVGMLDLMYATVQEQLEGQSNHKVRQIFQMLKNNIEVVQDSSKRAVEAADNVVQAYDLNMQVPETPSYEHEAPIANVDGGSYFDMRPTMTDGSQIINPNKRKREAAPISAAEPATKLRNIGKSPSIVTSLPRSPVQNTIEVDDVSPKRKLPPLFGSSLTPHKISMPAISGFPPEADTPVSTPGFRQTNIRDALPIIINGSLRVGGRPDFAVSEPTALGESIEVRSRDSNGHVSSKIVKWMVEADVPQYLPIDERDLHKLIGAVFLNALKFTDHGEIVVRLSLSSSQRYVLVNISDTGFGIPEAFQPELFKAFSKEDDRITRTTEGLGLGLMVAKGLSRKIGGDLHLVRSAVEGPNRGSEFEMRLPLEACDLYSRASTPAGPSKRNDEYAPRSVPSLTKESNEDSPTSSLPEVATTEQANGQIPKNVSIAERRSKSPATKSIETPNISANVRKPSIHRRGSSTLRVNIKPDRQLASKYPLTFLVAEDNKINRKLLVQMLNTLGYKDVHEAYDGKEAVRIMDRLMKERSGKKRNSSCAPVDVILMDLWMPELDGYQATEQILKMFKPEHHVDGYESLPAIPPTVLAVSADVTDDAIDRATKIGMAGYMSKPFKVLDLQKLILEFCIARLESNCCAAAA